LITGNYAIATSGLSGASIQQLVGEMASNGAGSVSSGAIDVNTGGTLSPGVAVTGAYATSSSAERGTLTLALPSPLNQPRDFAVYAITSPLAVPSQRIIVIRIDAGLPASGQMYRQF
jgi:hypothetical protein